MTTPNEHVPLNTVIAIFAGFEPVTGIAAIPLPPGEPIKGETLVADGWLYRDFNGFLAPKDWDELLSIIGKNHYRLICFTKKKSPAGVRIACRGQFLIAPQGIENLKGCFRG